MGLFNLATPEMALEDLLSREQDALLNGKLEMLEGIADEKEKLLQTFLRRPPEADALLKLQKMAAKNSDLLNAAKEGLTSAAKLLASLSAPQETQATYGPSGTKTVLSKVRPKITQRF